MNYTYLTFLIVPVIVSWFLALAKREDSNNKDGYVDRKSTRLNSSHTE